MRATGLLLSFFMLTTTSTFAQSPAPDTINNPVKQKRDELTCEGPFAKDATHAKLVAAFGAANVVFKDVDGAEGSTEKATVLFDADPTRRLIVFWHDEKARAKPSLISVKAPSLWIGPGGIGNGMKISEVEKLNGKPFKLNGFEWDGGGYANDLDGKLKSLPGGCAMTIRFEPGIANPLSKKYAAIVGDKRIASDNKLMRGAKPQVSEWGIGYPE